MKTQLSFWAMCLLMVSTLSGQIKIGDNPQNIDPASVLELESTSRVLVITRVTDAQMSSITPLRGALVYNTDQDCLHYYDGNEWINICEAFNDAFTVSTNAVFNPFANDSTVVVTQTDTNYNFEVNQITGDNIVDTSINGANEIQQGSITGLQLSDATITFDKLADGENTGDLLRWNGNEWVLVDETAITVTELDGVVGNEVTGPADTTLELSGAGDELSPYLLDVSAGGIGTNELANNAVTRVKIENGLNPGELMQWDGSNWVLVNETALNITEAQDLENVIGLDASAGNQVITNLSDPTNPQDAATKNYVDSEITNNAADGSETILSSGTDINITGNGTTATPYVINSTFTEAQDLEDVIGLDASAGNQAITNLSDPTNPQDAATKNYVDSEITNNAADGSETILSSGTDINITGNGTTATPYVINSTFTEAQDLEDVIGLDASAGNQAITNLSDPTNPQDAATKNYVDSEITNNAADGSETILSSGTDINITGNGTTATPYVINSTFTEAQDLEDVIGLDASAGNQAITNLSDPTNPQDAATKNYVDSEITNNAADGSETILSSGTDINITGNGTTATPYVINSTFTEAQDLEDVIGLDASAGNQAITNLSDPTNPQDAATKNYVDSEITNNAADGSETILSSGTDINITGNGTTATPYVINSTFTEAQDLEDVIGLDASAGNQAITNLSDPTNPQDAATKNYVDTVVLDEIVLSGQVTSAIGTAGAYTINNAAITATSIIQLTVQENTPGSPIMIQLTNQIAGSFSVQIYEFTGPGFTATNADWQYIVVTP